MSDLADEYVYTGGSRWARYKTVSLRSSETSLSSLSDGGDSLGDGWAGDIPKSVESPDDPSPSDPSFLFATLDYPLKSSFSNDKRRKKSMTNASARTPASRARAEISPYWRTDTSRTKLLMEHPLATESIQDDLRYRLLEDRCTHAGKPRADANPYWRTGTSHAQLAVRSRDLVCSRQGAASNVMELLLEDSLPTPIECYCYGRLTNKPSAIRTWHEQLHDKGARVPRVRSLKRATTPVMSTIYELPLSSQMSSKI